MIRLYCQESSNPPRLPPSAMSTKAQQLRGTEGAFEAGSRIRRAPQESFFVTYWR